MDVLFAVIILGIVNMQLRNRIASIAALAVAVGVLQIEPPKETIEFGTYNGQPLKWEVMQEYDDGSKVIVTKDCVTERIFDDENNMWETSDLRQWLNSDFISEFTMDELARIEPKENEVMLTYNDRGLAVSGDHTHYWSATRSEVADLSESAYKYYVDDMVYIPTLDMMKTIDVRGSYWILCPYGYNDKMQRYMKNDGFILHTNVDNIDGVRAAVRIKSGVNTEVTYMKNEMNLTMLTDFYEFTMMNGFFAEGYKDKIAYFDMFFRRVPEDGGFAIMAGVEQIIEYIKEINFTAEDIEYLRSKGIFKEEFLKYLENFKFECDVWAVPDGTPIFPGEPIITVRGPVIQAQFVETMILLTINHQSLIATKANRIVRAAQGRAVMEFGSRRAQGYSAATIGARAAYIGGVAGTACTISDELYGVPALGTMAHSWVQLFDSEYEAFLCVCEELSDRLYFAC